MSIRFKMVLSIILVFIFGIAALGFFLQESYSTRVAEAADSALGTSATVFARLEKAETDKLTSTLVGLQSNDAFRVPFLAGDREALTAAAQPVFAELRSEHNITHWYFESVLPTGTVFLRVHKPEQFGDVLTRKTYIAASTDETQAAGLELGKTAVALRVVRPYYGPNGKLIGYLELGQEIDSFLGDIKAQTGDEVGLLLAKKGMDATGWADVATQNGRKNTWDDLDEYVLAGSTSDSLTEEIARTPGLSTVGESGKVFGVFSQKGGTTETRVAFPIKDAAGEPIGLMYIEHDITPVVAEIAATRLRMMGAVGAMMAVVLGVVLLLMNGLIFGRLNHMIADMESISTRVAGGDYEVSYQPKGGADEIGRFEQFYADFISLVSGALKQLSDAMKN